MMVNNPTLNTDINTPHPVRSIQENLTRIEQVQKRLVFAIAKKCDVLKTIPDLDEENLATFCDLVNDIAQLQRLHSTLAYFADNKIFSGTIFPRFIHSLETYFAHSPADTSAVCTPEINNALNHLDAKSAIDAAQTVFFTEYLDNPSYSLTAKNLQRKVAIRMNIPEEELSPIDIHADPKHTPPGNPVSSIQNGKVSLLVKYAAHQYKDLSWDRIKKPSEQDALDVIRENWKDKDIMTGEESMKKLKKQIK